MIVTTNHKVVRGFLHATAINTLASVKRES